MTTASPHRTPLPQGFWRFQSGLWLTLSTLLGLGLYSLMREVMEVAVVEAMWRTFAIGGMGFAVTSAFVPTLRRLVDQPPSTPTTVTTVIGVSALGALPCVVVAWLVRPPPRFHEHGPGGGPHRAPPSFLGELLFPGIPLVMLLLAWSSLFLTVMANLRAQAEQVSRLAMQAQATEARLDSLRQELNPHFLFNALNSIYGAIDEDPARAQQMILRLSEVLRYSLRRGAPLVQLADELPIVRAYLDIERTRFDERLEVTQDVAPAAESLLLPPLALLTLVENAVKHGMRSSPMPLRLRLVARSEGGALHLVVTNTGALAAQDRDGAVGLKNLRERLGTLFPQRHHFTLTQNDDGEVQASLVTMPEAT
jgi:two-component system, LytTR family, sensor kinase